MAYYLEARFDSRKSFYYKAQVEVAGNVKSLFSYGTKVCEVRDGVAMFFEAARRSQTTKRHVREFLKQEGLFEEFPI